MGNFSSAVVRESLVRAFTADELRLFTENFYKKVADNQPKTVSRDDLIQALLLACVNNLDKLVRQTVNVVEDTNPSKCKEVTSYLSAQSDTAIVSKKQLVQVLTQIDFVEQISIGLDVSEQSRIAAFWIWGDVMSGQDMLSKRLLDQVAGNDYPILIDLRGANMARTSESIWDNIASTLSRGHDEKAAMIQDIAEIAKRDKVIIVIRGASGVADLQQWLSDFWTPLVETATPAMKSDHDDIRGSLLLLLVDYLSDSKTSPHFAEEQAQLKQYHDLMSLKWGEESFTCNKPVCLSAAQPFDDDILKKWRVASGLVGAITAKLGPVCAKIEDRRPMNVYMEIVKACNQDWSEISSWLK